MARKYAKKGAYRGRKKSTTRKQSKSKKNTRKVFSKAQLRQYVALARGGADEEEE